MVYLYVQNLGCLLFCDLTFTVDSLVPPYGTVVELCSKRKYTFRDYRSMIDLSS